MDAVIVGSGPNGLAAAVTLAAEGLSVTVHEAADRIGGGTRSGELTLSGLIHDECSQAHPFALDSEFSRRFDLAAHGLDWCLPEIQYAHPLHGGRGVAAHRSVQATAAGLGDGQAGARWARVFGPLVDRFDAFAVDFARPVIHLPRHPLVLARYGAVVPWPTAALARFLGADSGGALFSGVAAHAFRPLWSPVSAAPGVVLGAAAHRFGWPVARGGSGAITRAMASLLTTAYGGRIETGSTVRSLAELGGSAEIVILDTSVPGALEICGPRLPSRIARAYRRFGNGPGAFKVDWAISEGVPWLHEPSRLAGTVHVGGSFAEIAAAERDCARGRMPERPFVLVGQQWLADPSRATADAKPLYAYAHVPAGYSGDATAAIEAQIERFAPGFRERILARHVTDVAALQAGNPNYVGGDIATGACDARQLFFRPRVSPNPYFTGIPGVYLCSAATPPGPGAHGICGYNAARAALRRL